jgi:hypothetical protein
MRKNYKLISNKIRIIEKNNNNWIKITQYRRFKANKHIVDTKNWRNHNVGIRIRNKIKE